jgi:hypothetical protein
MLDRLSMACSTSGGTETFSTMKLRGRQRVAEDADDARAHRVGELIEAEVVIGAGDLAQEQLGVDDLEVVRPERPRPDDAEIIVAHHHRIGGAPLVPREQAGVEEVDVRLERGFQPVLPGRQARQDRDVVRRQRVLARSEGIAELAEVHELRHLRLAHDELRAALDRLVLVGEAVRQRVARVVGPLDDLDQLALEEIQDAHVMSSVSAARSQPLKGCHHVRGPAGCHHVLWLSA